jgi:hypothetical protein
MAATSIIVSFLFKQKHLGLFFKPFQLRLESGRSDGKVPPSSLTSSLAANENADPKIPEDLLPEALAPLPTLVGMNAILHRKLGVSSFSPFKTSNTPSLECRVWTLACSCPSPSPFQTMAGYHDTL